MNKVESVSPIVSIVIPTFNRSELLKKSIAGVLKQSFNNWEIIVVDSSLSSETKDLIAEYTKHDNRFKYFFKPKTGMNGISDFLNFGIRSSAGIYIARLDDDDVWCNSQKLEMQISFMERNNEYVLTGGGVIMIDSEGTELYRFFKNETDEKIRNKALMACPMEHTTVIFRKDAAMSAGCYSNYRVAEDWDFFLRLGKIGKLYNFQEYFTFYLQGEQNLSLQDQAEVAITEMKIIKEFRKDYPGFLIGMFIHFIQYLYSFMPEVIKSRFQFFLRYIKRNYI
ncbi:MAG: glycosyltransferase [Ignavibacteria bacterium]